MKPTTTRTGLATLEMRRKHWQSKKRTPENLLYYRFQGTTLTYDEMIFALENVTLDKLTTTPVANPRKIDTNGSMDMGMAAEGGVSEAKSEEKQRVTGVTLPSNVHKCRTHEQLVLRQMWGESASWRKNSWSKGGEKKRGKSAGTVMRKDTSQQSARRTCESV